MPLYCDSLQYRFLSWKKPWRMNVSWAKIATIKVRTHPRPNRLAISVEDFLSDEEGSMRKLIEFQPDVVEGYASIIHELAQRVKAGNLPLHPRFAISGGENMRHAVRHFVTDALQTEVVSRYALEECGVIASECSRHDGLHTNCESLIVEIVDEYGRALPDGESGRILITDLFNYSMPLIRYDTGDHGTMSWQLCACGVTAPRLWLEGRHSAFLDFPVRRIHHLEFDATLDMFMNAVAQYQIVKCSEDRLEVRVVPGRAFDEHAKAEVVRNVEALVGPSIRVSLSVVEKIPFTERGKSQIVADESTAAAIL